MIWQPIENIPMDGTEILIKTDAGIVSAWFCREDPTNDAMDDGVYDWICFDDKFSIDGHSSEIIGWMPIHSESAKSLEDSTKAIERLKYDFDADEQADGLLDYCE